MTLEPAELARCHLWTCNIEPLNMLKSFGAHTLSIVHATPDYSITDIPINRDLSVWRHNELGLLVYSIHRSVCKWLLCSRLLEVRVTSAYRHHSLHTSFVLWIRLLKLNEYYYRYSVSILCTLAKDRDGLCFHLVLLTAVKQFSVFSMKDLYK